MYLGWRWLTRSVIWYFNPLSILQLCDGTQVFSEASGKCSTWIANVYSRTNRLFAECRAPTHGN